MPRKKMKGRELPALGERERFTAGSEMRVAFDEDHTRVELGALADRYKLRDAYREVRNLEFLEEEEHPFADYKRDRAALARRRFRIVTTARPKFPKDEGYRNHYVPWLYPHGKVLVLVAEDVYTDIAPSIETYVLDLARDGYWATVHVVHAATPPEIRRYIRRRRPVGAVLVGGIAAPWFEMDDDFHDNHSEFPCDLYYMDLNGAWVDADNDGMFNSHGRNVDPEIWIGRVYAPTMGGNDAKMLMDYFARNHEFRLGNLGHARSALAYPDDDWQGFHDCALDLQFPASEITVHNAPDVTDADLYKSEVNTLRSWVQLCAHSSVHSHGFKVSTGHESINTAYFRDVNPPNAHFYNLFCCGPGKYTASDYLAGWYVFDKAGGGVNHGLAAVASAKSGSMLFFEDFYGPLGKGDCIGDAFLKWWQARGPSHDLFERRWFYGLVLLGDPTLTWWKGAVPQLEQPQPNDVFDQWPRTMQLRWDPVNIPGATYTVEVDAFGAVNGGKWAEAVNQSGVVYTNITGNTVTHTFVGMQRGRWRVRATIDGQTCSWSPWRYFTYTV